MKIVIITYAISWLILLGIYIGSLFDKERSFEKESWEVHAWMIVLAPLVDLIFLFVVLESLYNWLHERRKKREWSKSIKKRYIHRKTKDTYRNTAKLPHDSRSSNFVMIAQTLENLIKEKEYDLIMQNLDRLSLPKGAFLHVEECKQTGIGDASKLVIVPPKGACDMKIWNYIKAEDDIVGAWQAYLLYRMGHILPLFWHALYGRRTYLYSETDVANIVPITKKDATFIRDSVKPLITGPNVIKDTNGKYYVSCCYWSDFAGLIQETVEVTITFDNNVSFKDIATKTLFEYKCRIRF